MKRLKRWNWGATASKLGSTNKVMQIKILKRDETEYWADDIVARAGRIFGVYAYDPSRKVHCCELTASYELHFIESQAEKCPDDDHERERLDDEIREGDLYTEPVTYIHCHEIDKLPVVEDGKMYFPNKEQSAIVIDMGNEWGNGAFESIPADPFELTTQQCIGWLDENNLDIPEKPTRTRMGRPLDLDEIEEEYQDELRREVARQLTDKAIEEALEHARCNSV
jgi:hypothetical protein